MLSIRAKVLHLKQKSKNSPRRQTTGTVQSSSPLSFCLSVSRRRLYNNTTTLSPSAPPDCTMSATGSLSRGSSSNSPRLSAPERVLCFYKKTRFCKTKVASSVWGQFPTLLLPSSERIARLRFTPKLTGRTECNKCGVSSSRLLTVRGGFNSIDYFYGK